MNYTTYVNAEQYTRLVYDPYVCHEPLPKLPFDKWLYHRYKIVVMTNECRFEFETEKDLTWFTLHL